MNEHNLDKSMMDVVLEAPEVKGIKGPVNITDEDKSLILYASGPKVNLYINALTDIANSYCLIHPNLEKIKVLVAEDLVNGGLEYAVISDQNQMLYHTRYGEELINIIDLLAGNNDTQETPGGKE